MIKATEEEAILFEKRKDFVADELAQGGAFANGRSFTRADYD